MKGYISDHIVEYFKINQDPLVRYLFFDKLFPEEEYDKPEILSLNKYSFLRKYISDNKIRDIHKWHSVPKGAFYRLYIFAELGFDSSYEFITNTLDYLVKHYVNEDGGFRFNWKSQVSSVLWTGELLFLIHKLNYRNSVEEKLKSYLIRSQIDNGSWKGMPIANTADALKLALNGKLSAESSKERPCLYATISAIKGLLPLYETDEKVHDIVDKGLHYLLNRKIFFKEQIESSDGFLENKYFKNIGVPIFAQADLLSVLDLFSRTDLKNHKFVTSAFNHILKYETENYLWKYKSKAPYMLEMELPKYNKKEIDPYLSIKICEVLGRY